MMTKGEQLCAEAVQRSRTRISRVRNSSAHPSYLVPVLVKALVILDVMRKSERPYTVAELAKLTAYPVSTVYRILRTCSAFGLLPDGDDGVYCFIGSSGVKNDWHRTFATVCSHCKVKRS
jgi:hypothetical protein